MINQKMPSKEQQLLVKDCEDDDQIMLYEPRKHETKLRRWVTHFHSEIIFPIEQTHVDYLEQSGQQAET